MTDRTIRQINREDGEWIADFFRRFCLHSDVFDKICSTCSITEDQARHILKLRKVNIAQTIKEAEERQVETQRAEREREKASERGTDAAVRWVLGLLICGVLLVLGYCAVVIKDAANAEKSPAEQACEDMGGQSDWSGDKCVFLNP